MELEGKVAIVTGGNSGIGMAIVLALAEQGANIVIDYVANPDATEALEQRLHAMGDKAVGVEADVSKVDELQKLVDAAVKAFGRLDVMVNNAGIETRTGVLDTTEQQYDRVMDINLKSAFFGTQIAARQMLQQGDGGRIINVTSVHEDWPMPGNTPYCLSKGGMRMLTRTAGIELAPHGILVTGVGPGAVDTPINASTAADPAEDEDAQRRHPHRPDGRARGDRLRCRLPRREGGDATWPPPRSSPTAGSCTPAPDSDPTASPRFRPGPASEAEGEPDHQHQDEHGEDDPHRPGAEDLPALGPVLPLTVLRRAHLRQVVCRLAGLAPFAPHRGDATRLRPGGAGSAGPPPPSGRGQAASGVT